jgi:cell division protein FtsI (penicillin-binding protein 3)
VVAAPAFKSIGEQMLPYMGVYPKGVTYLARMGAGMAAPKEGTPANPTAQLASVEASEDPGVMPDFAGKSLRQVVLIAQRLGLDLKLVGSGKAISQNPPPGNVLQGQTRGVVKFSPAS